MRKVDGFLRTLIQAAKDQGWRIETLGSGHLRFWPPIVSGQPLCRPVIAGGTAGSDKALVALRCNLKRGGLRLAS